MSDKNDVVFIELDRPRMLWYGHKAMKKLAALTGKDIDAAMQMENLDLEEIEKIMYCGLLTDATQKGEVLKLEDMEDLLDYAPFGTIIKKMQEAFNAAFGCFDSPNLKGIAEQAQQKK